MLCSGAICGRHRSALAQTIGTPEVTLRSNVAEARMTFSITDQNNRVIATLQPGDFAIVDHDFVVREFRSFTRSESTRLDVAVLVDASASAASQFHLELPTVLELIAASDGRPDETLSLISFRDLNPTIVCEADCRSLDAAQKLHAIATGGQTPLYDSIVFGARLLARKNDLHARKVLILFSDGADTISLKSLTDAINSALDNDVAIYSVDISAPPRVHPGTLVLRNLSFYTGGRYFPFESGSATILGGVLEDFHAAYTVAYKLPSRASGFHLVRILPTHDLGLQFHCRRGYYYPSTPEN
jgi:Ca-activated chloride channel homolog